ncbi:MAG: ABC transporter [Maricaulis sp.]|jgi:ABC-2 type transport system permease protein|nr:ABC transporter [Maricaulis sp.]HAQ35759.1 ABC transporter [Alphaproteobacteria bacterium]
MIRVMRAETLKLRRSLVAFVLGVPPVMTFILTVLVQLSGESPGIWQFQMMATAGIWAYFLLPMTATGLTALLAQMEHGPGTWSQILATPTPKWQVFTGKIVMALALMALVSALIWVSIFASGYVGGWINPEEALAGTPPWWDAAKLLAKMFLASALLIAVQIGVALRFNSFALPVSVGIGGTFVAVAATSSKYGIYFPWLLPINMLASEASRAEFALMLGGLGGAALLAAIVIWLSRRDWH